MPEPDDDTRSQWNFAIDSLTFRPAGHRGVCVIHRRAFQTLLGHQVSPEHCTAFFGEHLAVFDKAAATKIARVSLDADANFHLTSRDIARAR
jgi:hypothetical protein